VLVTRGLNLGKKRSKQKKRKVHWTSILVEPPQKMCKNSRKAIGDNAGSQSDDVMQDSQSGSLRTRSEMSHFEIVESDKKEAGASDEACENENSSFVRTIALTNNSSP